MKIRTKILSSCLLLIAATALTAQTTYSDSTYKPVKKKVYHFNHLGVGAIILGGCLTDYPAIGRIKSKPNLTDSEVVALNPSAINSFDQMGLRQNPANQGMFANISDYSQIPIFMLPAFLAFNKDISRDWVNLLYMYIEGHVITFTLYNYSFFGPTFQDRYRPLTYYKQFSFSQRESGNNRNSFYSGHVASTAYASFFIAKVFCDYLPDAGGSKYWMYAAALIPPAFMSYCRVAALDHFPSDCMVGFMLGSTVGILIPEIHKYHCKSIQLGLYTPPGATGLTCLLSLPESKKLTLQETCGK